MWPETEIDLARVAVRYLTEMRWDVYQEVEIARAIADIVATQGPLVQVVEVKRTLGLSVLAQAHAWLQRGWAHMVSVAVPNRSRYQGFARVVAAQMGIGVLALQNPDRLYCGARAYADWLVRPQLLRKAKTDRIRRTLRPEHKTYAEAGNSDGRRWTPFRATCKAVVEVVTARPGLTPKQLVDAVDHHYASDASAKAHLIRWVREGAIDGIEVRTENRRVTFWPAGTEAAP